jgi:hypothetical protein
MLVRVLSMIDDNGKRTKTSTACIVNYHWFVYQGDDRFCGLHEALQNEAEEEA